MAKTYQAGARGPIRQHHLHRRILAIRPAQQGHRQVHDFAAGRDDGVLDRVAAGVDDLYPDARLLLAAACKEETAANTRTAPPGLQRLLLPHGTLVPGASMADAGSIACLPGCWIQIGRAVEVGVLSHRSAVPVHGGYLSAQR